ncbi:MAG: hypothetical protein FWE38_03360 [Firmicutes bacterium]|nr:hypothetical protein [Bacillota bacterium]
MVGEKKKRRIPNRYLVLFKVITACMLLFMSAMFFFDHLSVFADDFRAWNLTPIIFFLGIIAVMAYIGYLVYRIYDETYYRAERWDLVYKIVFCVVLLYIGIRSLFLYPYLNVHIPTIIIILISGLLNWLIPPITLNDSEEF